MFLAQSLYAYRSFMQVIYNCLCKLFKLQLKPNVTNKNVLHLMCRCFNGLAFEPYSKVFPSAKIFS